MVEGQSGARQEGVVEQPVEALGWIRREDISDRLEAVQKQNQPERIRRRFHMQTFEGRGGGDCDCDGIGGLLDSSFGFEYTGGSREK